MNVKSCPKCGARWIDGQLYWATGKQAKEEDLAGLVCNNLGDETCINPKKGNTSGDTWEKRQAHLDSVAVEWELDGNL